MATVSKSFMAKFERWAKYMVECGELTEDDIAKTKEAIRLDAEDGPDQVRNPEHAISTREERIEHWDRYFDYWLPVESGINERIRNAA